MIRELANCRPVDYKGSHLQFPWARTSALEVWVAAYGPLALKAAGEVGDGFILQLADVDIADVDDQVASARPPPNAGRDPDAITFCVAAPDVRRRTTGRTCATSAAGSAAWSATTSPTSWPSTASTGDGPAGADRLHQGPRRATTTTSTAGPATPTPPSCPTRSSTGSASSAPPRTTSPSSSSSRTIGVDQFAGYLQHDNKEETLRVYGETIMPGAARARDREGLSADAASRARAQPWALRRPRAARCWSPARGSSTRRSARRTGVRGRRARAILPRTDDRAMPHVWDMVTGSFEPATGPPARRPRSWRRRSRPACFTLRIAARGLADRRRRRARCSRC